MKKFRLLASIFAIGFVITSCGRSNNDDPGIEESNTNIKIVKNFRTEMLPPRDPNQPPGPPSSDPANKFTLYNLRENKPVDFAKFDTDEWDIGFRTTAIIVNGGEVRKGKGGVFIQDGTFDEIESVSAEDTRFAGDKSDKDFAIPSKSDAGWYHYTGSPTEKRHNILPIPGKILILKTGDGEKHAKIEILSYYKDSPKDLDPEPARDITGFYTFKYSLF